MQKAGQHPVLTAGGAVASEAQALKSATNDELNRVAIRTTDGSISIALSRNKATVVYATSSESAARTVSGVARLLAPRRQPAIVTWLGVVAKNFAVYGLGMLVILGIGVLFRPETIAKLNAADAVPAILIVLAISVVLGSVSFLGERKSGGAKVLAYFRSERRDVTFSARQAWLIGTVTAVLSGAIGSWVTWLLTNGA